MYIALRSTGPEYLVVAPSSSEISTLMLLADSSETMKLPDASAGGRCGYSSTAWLSSSGCGAFVPQSWPGTYPWTVWWLPKPDWFEQSLTPLEAESVELGRTTLRAQFDAPYANPTFVLDLPLRAGQDFMAYALDDQLDDETVYNYIYLWLARIGRTQGYCSEVTSLLVPANPRQRPNWDRVSPVWLEHTWAVLRTLHYFWSSEATK